MDKKMKIVSAGIIYKGDEVLIAQRSMTSSVGGKWEFPGGKLEENETIEECLARELFEELNISVKIRGVIGETAYKYAHVSFNLLEWSPGSKSKYLWVLAFFSRQFQVRMYPYAQ